MNLKTFFSTFFVIQMFAESSFANTVTCNRNSDDTDGFTTRKARDYWFPKATEMDVQSFVEKGGGTLAVFPAVDSNALNSQKYLAHKGNLLRT